MTSPSSPAVIRPGGARDPPSCQWTASAASARGPRTGHPRVPGAGFRLPSDWPGCSTPPCSTSRSCSAGRSSVAWSLAIWWLGESLGGIFTGAASPLTGAPGAVLLYALLALLAWPARAGDREHASAADASAADASAADSSPLGARWSRILWLALWGSSAGLILQPQSRAPGALRASIAALAAGEPRWIAALDQSVAVAAGRGGALIPVLLAAAFAMTGAAIFVPAAVRPAVTLSIILAMIIWVTGENFGGILTGQATDPNTGPLLALLALAFWPRRVTKVPCAGS
jgi:hypothetical protein